MGSQVFYGVPCLSRNEINVYLSLHCTSDMTTWWRWQQQQQQQQQ
jgi:hypothetical protein